MDIEQEHVQEVYQELDELLHDYFEKTIAKEGLPILNMDWRSYFELQKREHLMLLTARDDYRGRLMGFVMYYIYPHLHHKGFICAACDILAVRLEQRGRGIGMLLMEHAEPLLKDHRVRYITHQFRVCYDTAPLFPRMGYKLIEQGYLKELD
jgi:GNAT superfamily N-acetyltransferase